MRTTIDVILVILFYQRKKPTNTTKKMNASATLSASRVAIGGTSFTTTKPRYVKECLSSSFDDLIHHMRAFLRRRLRFFLD